MIHVDLFSGIGGFAYAADQVWDDVEHIFCDYEPFAQAVLNKHWPESEIYKDVRTLTTNPDFQRSLERRSEVNTTERKQTQPRPTISVDILTGGFPCQPFSAAGVRRGTNDDRYLWPAMLEVIQYCKPTWVIAENVGGLLTWEEGVVFEQVCADLESSGYEVQPLIIPAAAVGAPHRRDRIWFIASNTRRKHGRQQGAVSTYRQTAKRSAPAENTERYSDNDADPQRKGLERSNGRKQTQPKCAGHYPDWNEDWTKAATKFCSVDDGLPGIIGDTTITKSKHRAEQLKAYGNAIVPQVAIEIMEGMKLSDRENMHLMSQGKEASRQSDKTGSLPL